MAGRVVSPEKKHEFWVRQWRHRKDVFYKRENDLYGILIAFALDQEHYKRNAGEMNNDSARIQPKGQQLTNLIRHKLSKLTSEPITFQTRPVQPLKDANASIVSRRVIEQVIEDPKRRYPIVEHRMILSGLAGARGCLAFEWDHSVNGVVFRNVDPRFLYPTPGFLDLHNPQVPDVIEEVPMKLSQVRRMQGWKVPKSLQADGFHQGHPTGVAQESHMVDMDGTNNGIADVSDGTEADGIVTVLKCYSRRDPFNQTRVATIPTPLPQNLWYWTNDAGERVMVADSPEAPGEGFRMVTNDEDARELELFTGGYLSIIFPYSPVKEPAFEGTWLPDAVNTDVRLRSFPYLDYAPYLHPLRRAGQCDTQLNHSLQLIDNASFRAAWMQMRSSGAVMTVLKGSLKDAQGRAWEPSDKVLDVAYADDRIALEGIGFHQAPGMNSALPQFRQMLDRQWSYIGSGDVAMPAERSRDIAVGTIQAMQESGDLPIQMHRAILNADRAIGFGLILDYERAYRSDAQLVQWVVEEGEMAGQLADVQVTGADLVDVNVLITTLPGQRAMDSDRMQAVAQFAGQMAALGDIGPEMMAALAPEAGLSAETVRALRGVIAEKQRQTQMMQQMQMQQSGPMTGPGGGQPTGPAGQGAPPVPAAA